MFPWVCLAETLLFFDFDMPRLKTTIKKGEARKPKPEMQLNSTHKLRTFMILWYCAIQLFLPYSHFITKGYNNWTNGLYGYSWDMMVHSYETTLITIKIVDNSNGEQHFLNPYAFTEYDRWTKYADMAWQYAHCIRANIDAEFQRLDSNQPRPLNSNNISIYFDIWCSMNARFQQRVFDPRVDLLQAKWSPFEHTNWSLPLLNELTHMRPQLLSITNEVLNWNNYSDVVFVADLPGLTLHNYISPDLTNITLTVLSGSLRYESDQPKQKVLLSAGNTLSLPIAAAHRITTLGSQPSCYMYIFTNQTMLLEDIPKEHAQEQHQQQAANRFLLWNELLERIENYRRFLNHISNCLLFLFYKVPIPMELRSRD